jgi:spermidine synthase
MNDDIQRFKHIENYKLENAKLFGDRFSAIHFVVPENPRYLEIGVGDGHYSQHIVDYKKPQLMHLLDIYSMGDPIYGHYTAETHEQYILNKFAGQSVKTIKGHSTKVLSQLSDNKYDYIYLDASTDFNGVLYELEMASKMLDTNGVIGINDYTYFSPIDKMEYEVVEATNMFLFNNPEWYVYAYQLGHRGYADIYIKRD